MTGRSKLVVALVAIAAVAAMVAWTLRPKPRPSDPFNECIAQVVLQENQSTRGLKLDLSQILPRLPTSKDGDSPTLKVNADATDKEVFRTLTDSQWTKLVEACEHQYARRVGPLNPEIQVWTRLGGHDISAVLVRRVLRAGDKCVTDQGTCLLVLHDYQSGTAETLVARAHELSGQLTLDAKTIVQGAANLDLSQSSRHAILLLSKGAPLPGTDVTIEDGDSDGKLLSVACADADRAGEGCLTAGTGSDGRGAVFEVPSQVSSLKVSFLFKGSLQRCTATSQGTTFQVDMAHDCQGPPVPQCSPQTVSAVGAVLRNDPRGHGLEEPFVKVAFDVVEHHTRTVSAKPDGDRATLVKSILGPDKTFSTSNCHGELRWPE